MTDAKQIADGLDKQGRFCLNYHSHPDRSASCGNMGADMGLLIQGLLTFAPDGRLELTPLGHEVRKIPENENG